MTLHRCLLLLLLLVIFQVAADVIARLEEVSAVAVGLGVLLLATFGVGRLGKSLLPGWGGCGAAAVLSLLFLALNQGAMQAGQGLYRVEAVGVLGLALGFFTTRRRSPEPASNLLDS